MIKRTLTRTNYLRTQTKSWYDAQSKNVQFFILACSFLGIVGVFMVLYYKYGAAIAGAFSRFLHVDNETTPDDETAGKGNAAAESVVPEAAASPQATRGPLSTDYPSKLFDPEYCRRYVHELSTARADRDAFEQYFQRKYVEGDNVRWHKLDVLRSVHAVIPPGTKVSVEELDRLTTFFTFRRIDRYRIIYRQKWEGKTPRG